MWYNVLSRWERNEKYCLIFGLQRKYKYIWKLFSKQWKKEAKKERKANIHCQPGYRWPKQWWARYRVTKGSARSSRVVLWGKSNFEKWKFFYLILEEKYHLDMTSCDERWPHPAERKVQRDLMIVGGRHHPIVQNLYGGNNISTWVEGTMIDCWGSREQQWMELIIQD